jgi:hypothetical protein
MMPNDVQTATPHLNIPPNLLKKFIDIAKIDNNTALRLTNAVNGCKTMLELDSLVYDLELKRETFGFNKATCSYVLEQVAKLSGAVTGFAGTLYFYDYQQRDADDPIARQDMFDIRKVAIAGASFLFIESLIFGASY